MAEDKGTKQVNIKTLLIVILHDFFFLLLKFIQSKSQERVPGETLITNNGVKHIL